jgi:hypothetical protein
MEGVVKSFDSNINSVLQNFVKKPTIIRGIVHLLLMLYVVRLAPALPLQVQVLFGNIYFKLFVFSLVLWTANFSPSTSILIAIAFLVTMTYINTGNVWEYMENVAEQQAESKKDEVPPVVAKVADAISTLANSAASPNAAAPEVIAPAAQVVASVVSTDKGIEAVQKLAQQAVIPEAGEPQKVAESVTAVVDSIVQPAAPPAPVPAPAPAPVPVPVPAPAPAPVAAAPASGCYPMRNYDMSVVKPQVDGQTSFEDYQEYVSSQ